MGARETFKFPVSITALKGEGEEKDEFNGMEWWIC
jgi:hypothetical protein